MWVTTAGLVWLIAVIAQGVATVVEAITFIRLFAIVAEPGQWIPRRRFPTHGIASGVVLRGGKVVQ